MNGTLRAAALAAGLGLVAAPVAAQSVDMDDRSGWPDSFTVGTASQGGTYFTYGSGWANLVAEELGISGGGQVTGGPVQNMALVHAGDVEMGMTTLGPAFEAVNGRSPLAPGNPHENVRAMFPMYETPFVVTVLASSGVERIADIEDGAVIGFGPAGSTSDTYFPAMLETVGVEFNKRNGSWSDLAGQLQDGLLDVIAFAAGIPTPAVSQLEAQNEIRVLSFTEEEINAIIEAFPVAEFTIPQATYQSLDADKQAVSMWNFAIASAELPASFVYNVMEIVLGNNERMVEIHRAARATKPEFFDRNTFLPFHEGAWKWYEDNGFEVPDDLKG
jgi:hypothetical protein